MKTFEEILHEQEKTEQLLLSMLSKNNSQHVHAGQGLTMSNRDAVKVVEDIMWLLTVTRSLLRNIQEKNLVEEFAGEDSNAFDYVQDEVEKMWEKYT